MSIEHENLTTTNPCEAETAAVVVWPYTDGVFAEAYANCQLCNLELRGEGNELSAKDAKTQALKDMQKSCKFALIAQKAESVSQK